MRILVVIPHYFGPAHPENNLPTIGSYIEPLGRIAALNEAIVSLHRHFGPNRHFFDGSAIAADADGPERQVDIVILAIRGRELTSELGLAPGTIEVEYVDCNPPWIAFESQRVFRDRLGQYDFYCFMEDDLIIHDPAFFDKLAWFQRTFDYKTLLMPVRCEVPATGTPAKVIADIDLSEHWYRPFRRPGQREEIEGVWNGRAQTFHLPKNPHSGAFFLTGEQMDYWADRPSYGDRSTPWTGPIESAGTLSVGRVFDIYKPVHPDPFFLELQHFGVRYSSQSPPEGRRYGEPPLLAIAQNALRAALGDSASGGANGWRDPSIASLVGRWLEQGTAVELRGQLDALERETARKQDEEARSADERAAEKDALTLQIGELHQQRDHLNQQVAWLERSLGEQMAQRVVRDMEIDRLTRKIEQAGRDIEHLTRQAAQAGHDIERLTRQNEQVAHDIERLTRQNEQLGCERDEFVAQVSRLNHHVEYEKHAQLVHQRSLRWLLGSIRAEVRRRWQNRTSG